MSFLHGKRSKTVGACSQYLLGYCVFVLWEELGNLRVCLASSITCKRKRGSQKMTSGLW